MRKVKIIIISIFLSIVGSPLALAFTPSNQKGKGKASFIEFITNPEFIIKYLFMLAVGILAFFLLKTKKMNKSIKVTMLLVSTFLFGFFGNLVSAFGMHPSPMCTITKPFLQGYGLRSPFIISFLVISFLTLLGPKLFCGWVCPVGAAQELISMISDKFKIKQKKFSFKLANTIRIGILVVFFLVSATAFLKVKANGNLIPKSIYDYMNAFHGMEFESFNNLLGYAINYLPFILTIILAFTFYRPFCHYICPIGIYTNILEHIAVFRISLKEKDCNNCNICINKSPCKTLPYILNKSKYRADCFSCNRCIEDCPRDAFEISIKQTIKK